MRALLEVRHDFIGVGPWRQFFVGLNGFVAETVEEDQNLSQAVEELFLLLGLRQHDKGEVQQPAAVFLQDEALRLEGAAARLVAFLPHEIGTVTVWPPCEVHHLATCWVIAESGHLR